MSTKDVYKTFSVGTVSALRELLEGLPDEAKIVVWAPGPSGERSVSITDGRADEDGTLHLSIYKREARG